MAQMKGWHHIPTEIQTKILRLALFAESRGVTGYMTAPFLQINCFGVDRCTRRICQEILQRDFLFVDLWIHECPTCELGQTPTAVKQTLAEQYPLSNFLVQAADSGQMSLSRLGVPLRCKAGCKTRGDDLRFCFVANEVTILDLGSFISHRIHTLCLSQEFTFDCPLGDPYVDNNVRRILRCCSTLVDGPQHLYADIEGIAQPSKAHESLYRTLHKTLMSGSSARELLTWAERYLNVFDELVIGGTPVHELLTLAFRVTDQYHYALAIEGLPDLESKDFRKARTIGSKLIAWLAESAGHFLFILPYTVDQQDKCMVAQAGGRSLFTWTNNSDGEWSWDYPRDPDDSSGGEGQGVTDLVYCDKVEQQIKMDLAMARTATLRPRILWRNTIRATWKALKLRLGLPGSSNIDENVLQPDWHFLKPKHFLQDAKTRLDLLSQYVADCRYATEFGDEEQPMKDWLAEVEETVARFQKAAKRHRRTRLLPVLAKPFAMMYSGCTFPPMGSGHADYRSWITELNNSLAAL